MMYDTDIMLILKRLDKFEEELKKLENEVKVLNAYVDTQIKNKYYPNAQSPTDLSKWKRPYGALGDIPCYLDNLSPEDRMKPIGISCPCPKCSPYSLSQGSLSDAGTAQVWYQGLAKLGDDVEE